MERDSLAVERPNKKLYKATLILLKIIPMSLALCDILNTILYCFGIDVQFLSYIGGVSFLTIVFLYLASYVFRFCVYHRLFLHYVLVNNIISIIDYKYKIGLPIIIYIITIGLLLFGLLYFHQKQVKHERNTKKFILKAD